MKGPRRQAAQQPFRLTRALRARLKSDLPAIARSGQGIKQAHRHLSMGQLSAAQSHATKAWKAIGPIVLRLRRSSEPIDRETAQALEAPFAALRLKGIGYRPTTSKGDSQAPKPRVAPRPPTAAKPPVAKAGFPAPSRKKHSICVVCRLEIPPAERAKGRRKHLAC